MTRLGIVSRVPVFLLFLAGSFSLRADPQPAPDFQEVYDLVRQHLPGINEADLNLAFWNGSAWVNVLPCVGCGVDTVNNRLTAVLDHFTEFALLSGVPTAGDGKTRVYLPAVLR